MRRGKVRQRTLGFVKELLGWCRVPLYDFFAYFPAHVPPVLVSAAALPCPECVMRCFPCCCRGGGISRLSSRHVPSLPALRYLSHRLPAWNRRACTCRTAVRTCSICCGGGVDCCPSPYGGSAMASEKKPSGRLRIYSKQSVLYVSDFGICDFCCSRQRAVSNRLMFPDSRACRRRQPYAAADGVCRRPSALSD